LAAGCGGGGGGGGGETVDPGASTSGSTSGSAASPAAGGQAAPAATAGATTAAPAQAGAQPAATTAAGAAAGTAGAAAGTIVPLYTPPGDPSWTRIVQGKQAHPAVRVVAVVNPANGPGPARDAAYAAGITTLTQAGIVVCGYVATGYGNRPQATVENDVTQWKAFYPDLGGIFFDEQSYTPGNESLYKGYSGFAKSKGLGYTIGNPGQDPPESFVGVVDTMLIYEHGGVSTLEALGGWHLKYPPSDFGVIPYATTMNDDYVRLGRERVGYIYLTDDNLPNPWDSLSSYFDQLLAALD
jgi:hypothetical protein